MDTKIINFLKNGGVGVLPTDTIYGLVGSALSQQAVERIYKLKSRTPSKASIILISSIDDLKLFYIQLTEEVKKFLEKIWPNPVSVILSCPKDKFAYLHRGTKTLAFRIPKNKKLLELLKQTGPLIAPSANPEGQPPAEDIGQAKDYFKDSVDFYLDGGKLSSPPSTLIEIQNGKVIVLREGAFRQQEIIDQGIDNAPYHKID